MNKFSPLIKFLGKAVLVYLCWYLLYDLWLHPKEIIDTVVINNSINISKWILNILGFEVFINQRNIGIQSTSGVWIGDACNGINLFALFAGFIICYPGNLKRKLIYIPLGILSIHLLNVLRIVILIIILRYSPQSLSFNHSYTFTTIVYSYIFLLWVIFTKQGRETGDE